MFKEFKKFALKGNMIDLAVGVIIGGAFNSLVSSLVNDVIMPLLSLVTGRVDFNNWFIALDGNKYETLALAEEAGVAVVKYGTFISGVLNFIIMAFVIFLMVKFINKISSIGKKEVIEEKTTRECPYCKSVVSIKAVRCPHCTSELELEEE